jgi:hypothetical protein
MFTRQKLLNFATLVRHYKNEFNLLGVTIYYNFLIIIIPCEQQLLIELAINSGDFYVMFQRENHFINKRIHKPRRINMKCIPAVNSVNKTNRNRYNSQF